MSLPRIQNWHIVLLGACIVLAVLLSACIVQPQPTPIVQASATPSSTATATASATPTSTPTPTPTPTAPPASVLGDLRQPLLSTPAPRRGAPCGVVDLLDFPLNPPDALNARGGTDYGVYRERFNGIHAGEDWGIGGGSLGRPVYSIGHGQVTYAEPRGWGVDIGTVIIRHVFSDSTTILSFYGHLDPPSVELRAGNCVARGDLIGRIGKPSTPPHLHFEIRSHMPAMPGPGYWSVDPSLAGWKPPSQFIWNNRMAALPGVAWIWSFTPDFKQSLGILNGDTFVAADDEQLVGIALADGQLGWSLPITDIQTSAALINADHTLIYTCDQRGRVGAFAPPEPAPGKSLPSPAKLWQLKLDAVGIPALVPLPDGGVAVYMYGRLFGVSRNGKLLWKLNSIPSPFEWTLAGDRLILTGSNTKSPIWVIDRTEPMTWTAQISGKPVVAGDQFFIYGQEGIYHLNPETRSPELLYVLPRAWPELGDMIALPDGGLLVAHMEQSDQRLIALNADGSLRWQRSYAHAVRGKPHLLAVGNRVYVALQEAFTYSNIVEVLGLDVDTTGLTRIFRGGTRNAITGDAEVWALGDDRLLINVANSSLVALDARLALEASAVTR